METSGTDKDSLVPIIDISNFNESTPAADMLQTSEHLVYVCKNNGYFFLKPSLHTQRILSKLIDAVRDFFILPHAEKQKLNNDETTWFRIGDVAIPGTGPGYRGKGKDHTFSHDKRESFNVGDESVVNNKWPENEVISQEWREYIAECAKTFLSTCVVLRRLIALSLGQDMMIFEQPGYFDKSTWLLGMVHCFGEISNPQQGIFGIRPHCDAAVFTLLLRDGQPGLQICPDKSKAASVRTWIDVPQSPTAHFMVNIGKSLERLSNGVFKATLHRVVNTTGEERYSSQFFYDTNIDTILAPFPECCGEFSANYPATTPGNLYIERLTANKETFE